MFKIAVLLTCFNRKSITVRCLESLSLFKEDFDVFLVDDGSTDGSADYVKQYFPQTTVINGSGDLFWSRGMALAWETAANHNSYDFFVWLNDDVVLYSNCFKELLHCSEFYNHEAIISGMIESEDRKEMLYGGSDENKKLIQCDGTMKEITYLNGNVVLVPKYVFSQLGNFDQTFHHDLGDVDYGLRARKIDIKVSSTRTPVGFGTKNFIVRLRQNNTSFFKRLKKVYSPLGSHPGINFYFRRRHYGFFHAVKFFLFQHFLIIIPDKVNTIIFKDKYK